MYHLNEKQALRAMIYFTDQFADRAGDDLLTLMGDISLRRDGSTFDAAAWHDWLACVKRVVDEDAGTSIELPSPGELGLSFQGALLGQVTPGLRWVGFQLVGEVIEASFYYDNVGDEELDLVSTIETYVAADFRDPIDVRFTAIAEPANMPRIFRPHEILVYLRHEPENWYGVGSVIAEEDIPDAYLNQPRSGRRPPYQRD